MANSLSFRTRVLLIVLAVAVIPLGMLGLWLTRSTVRSGEGIVRSRLEESLDQTVAQIISRWIRQRSALLFLTEEPEVLDALLESRIPRVPATLARRFDDLDPSVAAITVADAASREHWELERFSPSRSSHDPSEFTPLLRVSLNARERVSGKLLGTIEVRMAADGLLPTGGIAPALSGQVLGLFEAATQTPLLPLPFDPSLLGADEFRWGGDRWITVARTLQEPPVTVVAAAPLTPFTQPFEAAARRGTTLFLIVALTGLVLAALLANRLTRSLADLATAAEAVSRGDLHQRVEVGRNDEVGRVAQAFNTMTESLERTLDALSSRESLAAVGHFAASLAHEVRNPLSAIRVDLQLVEEGLPQDSHLRKAQERALREIIRLDETVSRALEAGRTGELHLQSVNLQEPVRAAANAAAPAFSEQKATVVVELGDHPLTVIGDAGALEQLFLNLLHNAAQALEPGGEAKVEIQSKSRYLEVTVRDNGSGIPPDVLPQVFKPLFTTRPEGTGLGLPIARRIAVAHRGSLELESVPGKGTTVRVQLPLPTSSPGAAALQQFEERL